MKHDTDATHSSREVLRKTRIQESPVISMLECPSASGRDTEYSSAFLFSLLFFVIVYAAWLTDRRVPASTLLTRKAASSQYSGSPSFTRPFPGFTHKYLLIIAHLHLRQAQLQHHNATQEKVSGRTRQSQRCHFTDARPLHDPDC